MSDDFDFGFTAVDDIPTTASEPSPACKGRITR